MPNDNSLLSHLAWKLVDDATARGREGGFVNTQGLRVTPQSHGYGAWIRVGSKDTAWAEAWFGVNYVYWAYEEETPLWLYFNTRSQLTMDIVNKIDYGRASFDLPIGVEYETVLDSVVDQLRDIAKDVKGTIPEA